MGALPVYGRGDRRNYVEPLYIAAEKGQLPELKRVIVGFGDRIAMEETLDGAIARVFGRPAPPAGAEAAPSPSAGAAGSVKGLLDDAASVLTRADEELRRRRQGGRRTVRGHPGRARPSPVMVCR